MKCDEAYLYICDNLDQEIESPQCRKIRKHLETCTNCKAYLESLKTTISLYKAMPTPSVSPATHRKLLGTIRTLATDELKTKRHTRRSRPV